MKKYNNIFTPLKKQANMIKQMIVGAFTKIKFHPGGQGCFQRYAGKDITQAQSYMRDVCIGIVKQQNQNNNQTDENPFKEDVVTVIQGQIN